MEYPKIETLYDRAEDHHVILGSLRRKEFGLVSKWLVTEKVDGTNIRLTVTRREGSVQVSAGGRTDAAQLLPYWGEMAKDREADILSWYNNHFPAGEGSSPECVLYGEGYGEGVQSGGGYRQGLSFRLFDVLIGTKWLDWNKVVEVAAECKLDLVPVIFPSASESDCLSFLAAGDVDSRVAELDGGQGKWMEGLVARTDPYLYDWRGHRLLWKLKMKDFG